ncbi:MAG: hypothetical protein MUC59_10035 [Saprospiraceae bacterium]|jgi:hypothetical protein|nr:hypothetical protein [Saprospiraceae bacterium]
MVITIQINTQNDYRWLQPFLEALKKTNAVIQVKGELPADNAISEKRKAYLSYLREHSIPVTKVEIPSRDERNER